MTNSAFDTSKEEKEIKEVEVQTNYQQPSEEIIETLEEDLKLETLAENIDLDENTDIAQAQIKEDNTATPPPVDQLNSTDNGAKETIIESVIEEDKKETSSDNTEDTASASDIAQQVSQIEPAAGNQGGQASSSSVRGYGFQSSFEAQGIIGLEDVGPIDPTELQYGVDPIVDEVFLGNRSAEDAPLPPLNPIIEISNYQVLEDSSVRIGAYAEPESANGQLTIIISGIPTGWGVSDQAFDSLDNPIGTGSFDSATGTWVIILPAGTTFDGGPVFSPPADSDIDALDLDFTVGEFDAVTSQSGSASEPFDIIVDAVADNPYIDAHNGFGTEGAAIDVDISGLTGEEVNNGVGLDDGSENVVNYQIAGVPAGFTLSAGTETFAGSGVYILTEAELTGLTVTPTNPNFSGSISLAATIFTTENPASDGEFDLTNNNAQASEKFTLTWSAVADKPTLKVADAQVKEDSSVFVPVSAELADTDGSEFLTITVDGIPSDWDFTGTSWTQIDADSYQIVIPAGDNYADGFTLTPPADSDVDLTGITVTATSTETSNGDSASISEDIDVIVDAVADAPTIDAFDDSGVEGATLDIDLTALTGEEVNNGVGSDDGSENIDHYEISGVPAGFTLSAGTETFPGSGVYILTPAEIAGLTITPTDSNFSGSINLVATVFTTENPVSDVEFDLTDNDAQSSDKFTLTWKPVINPPSINVNQGVDDVIVKEDNSVDVDITAQLGANPAANEYLSVTVTGIDASWGTFSAPIGTYNSVAGTWTITLPAGQDLNTTFTFAPNGDSDIDLTGLVAIATATDPDAGISANSAPDAFNVIVDAVADTPNLNANGATGEEGTTIPLTITTSVNDTDGSEVIELIKIGGVPNGATLTAGTFDAINNVWVLNPSDLAGLGINIPNGLIGDFTLSVESVAFEQNTNGIETDLTDNRASAFDTIKLSIDRDDIPEVDGDTVTVDETNLAPTTSASGNIVADFGSDAPGTITGNGSFNVGTLTSNGVTVDVAFNAATNTYTGTAAGSPIFTLVVQSNGDFTFTLEGVIDHPDATDPNDSLPLEFGVTATDADGDTATAAITVNVLDDGPQIHNKFKAVDESNLDNGPIGYTKTLDFDFGEDGAGSVEPTGTFIAKYQVGGPNQQLTSNNVPINVVVNGAGDGYIGTAGGDTIFTVTIDSLTGEYTYTQFAGIDHPDGTNPDDVIWLKFGVKVTDADGDTVTAVIGVDVHDDGVIAKDDCVKLNLSDDVAIGNVTDNDDLSNDNPNTVTQVKFEGKIVDIPTDGSNVTINGNFGVLIINNTGAYSYDPIDSVFSGSDSSALNPTQSDVDGIQSSITKDGITVEVANAGNFDISWVNTADGNGLGIDNLNSGDSKKVWPKGETFDISFDQDAQNVTLTIAEIGSNNSNGEYGLDYVVTLADGTEISGEQQFVPNEIIDGYFSFTLDASDFGGQLIESVAITSTNDGQYKGASFLLNNVEATYDHPECVQDKFEYVLSDADGDTDNAILKIKTIDDLGDLIVGQNVSDDANSNVPHLVNGNEGVIEGSIGNDILVGDAGGSTTVQQTQDYNFVFILDVSGSMGSTSSSTSKISLLKDAVDNLLTDISTYGDGEIKVHIVPFATSSKPSGTFTITDAGELTNLQNYLDGLSTGGFTNYEDPLQDAISWLEGSEPLGGNAITTTYFISDGAPNRYMNDANIPTSGGASTVVNEITGSDGTNEVATIQSLSNEVIAVGISVGSNISRLDVIDSGGDALVIDDPSDLTTTLAGTSPLDKLASVGDDFIQGGDGNDIIFGDVLFTDDLADLHGLTADDGAGWEVFERLENGESTVDAGWSRDDTIAYIRANSLSLSEESVNSQGEGRNGGNDTLNGGSGDDVIFGQEGNDIISGDLGNDVIYGGSGADIFLFNAINEGVDTVKDFDATEGDLLDLSAILTGYDASDITQDIADFVIATEIGGDTIISVDQTGGSGVSGSVQMAILEGVTGLDLDTSIKTDMVA